MYEYNSYMPLISFNRKLLLYNVMLPRIALAILAKQSAGFAFLSRLFLKIVCIKCLFIGHLLLWRFRMPRCLPRCYAHIFITF